MINPQCACTSRILVVVVYVGGCLLGWKKERCLQVSRCILYVGPSLQRVKGFSLGDMHCAFEYPAQLKT